MGPIFKPQVACRSHFRDRNTRFTGQPGYMVLSLSSFHDFFFSFWLSQGLNSGP
jgi:hypothetical protein